MISNLTIVFLIFGMIMGVVIPVGLLVFFKARYDASLASFFVGVGVMVVFALILEQIVHSIVLGGQAGSTIQNSPLLISLYGACMAGLFEEAGRFIGMKFLLKKYHDNKVNALMYGAGHGGIEAFVILTIGLINYVLYAVWANTGMLETMLAPLGEAAAAPVREIVNSLATQSPFMLLLSPVERIGAVIAQIAMSVVMWHAVTKKKNLYILVAFAMHFILDFVSAFVAKLGMPVIAIEVIIYIIAISFAIFAKNIYKKSEE